MSYNIAVEIEGISPLLQHRFPVPTYEEMSSGGQIATGEKSYIDEWRKALYVNAQGEVYQPAIHIESAMIKAAVNFKIQGRRGKTFKDLFRGNCFISPEEIPHGMRNPKDLDTDGDKPLYLDLRPVVIQRARVVRIRPAFKIGWVLSFEIEVLDDQIPVNVVQEVLTLAGKTIGIGDFRPKFGRFRVAQFQVLDSSNGKE